MALAYPELLTVPTASNYPGTGLQSAPGKYLATGLCALMGWGFVTGAYHAPELADVGWTSIPVRALAGATTSQDAAIARHVQELKERSGLSWAQVASLFGVTRRAVHFWVRGGNMTDDHLLRLERLGSAISVIDRSDPEATRAFLMAPDAGGVSMFSRLVAEVLGRRLARPLSPVDLMSNEPDSSYIPSQVVGGRSVELEQREL